MRSRRRCAPTVTRPSASREPIATLAATPAASIAPDCAVARAAVNVTATAPAIVTTRQRFFTDGSVRAERGITVHADSDTRRCNEDGRWHFYGHAVLDLTRPSVCKAIAAASACSSRSSACETAAHFGRFLWLRSTARWLPTLAVVPVRAVRGGRREMSYGIRGCSLFASFTAFPSEAGLCKVKIH